MQAAIVLHGLFLLVCYPDTAAKKCEIWVPHTRMGGTDDVHRYAAGFGSITFPIPSVADNPALLKIDLQPSTQFPFHDDVSHTPYEARQFTLANDKIQLDSTPARDIIQIPWPNEIYGFGRVRATAAQIAPNDSDEIKSPSLGGFMISETVVLYYKQGAPFALRDAGNNVIASAAAALADDQGNVLTWALELSSEPYGCSSQGDHSADFNSMLIKDPTLKTHPGFVLTGIAKTSPAGAEGTPSQILPSGVVGSPCLISVDQAKKITREAAHNDPNEHFNFFTAKPTGCGTVSYSVPGTTH